MVETVFEKQPFRNVLKKYLFRKTQPTRRFCEKVVPQMRSNSLKSTSEIVETLAHLYLQASNYTKIEHFHEIRFKDFEHSYKRAVSHHSFLQNNQFSCNLFFTITHIDFASYVDDNIPYTFANDIKEVFWKLKIALEKLFP